jgi:hypothetical protein
MKPTRLHILKLYKSLIRYSDELQFTDKTFFKSRVRSEFASNRDIEKPEEISFQYKKGLAFLEKKRLL